MSKELRAKRTLRILADASKNGHVFHGSPKRHNCLVPKKPYNPGWKRHRNRHILKTAVYGTRFVEIAILYALATVDIYWRIDRRKRVWLSNTEDLEFLSSGYVHICEGKFFDTKRMISSSQIAIKPKKKVKVTLESLKVLTDRKIVVAVRRKK